MSYILEKNYKHIYQKLRKIENVNEYFNHFFRLQ